VILSEEVRSDVMKKTREVLFNHRTKQRRYNGSEEV
jgi:hypothetical protein